MTVREFRKYLKKFPQDADVVFSQGRKSAVTNPEYRLLDAGVAQVLVIDCQEHNVKKSSS